MKNYNVGVNHPKFIDLTGKIIGNLTVLEYIFVKGRGKESRWNWKCLCSCGNECFVRTVRLNKENPQTCCKKCSDNRWSKERIKDDFLSLKQRIFRTYQRCAKNRNLEFSINFEEFLKLISNNCYYCNTSPLENKGDQFYTYGQGIFRRNGIDRVNNSKGYISENIVTCCKLCNRAKMDLDLKDFKNWIDKTYKNLLEKGSTTIPTGSTSQANGDGNGDYPGILGNEFTIKVDKS